MNFKSLFSVVLLTASTGFAGTFECQSFLNLSNTASRILETRIDEKLLAVKSNEVTAYLTEKADSKFVLEVFIPESEMRIYSEGTVLAAEQSLTASAWTRDYIIDVTCRKMK